MSQRRVQRVFLEVAVIVGSILLAFGIEAWWDRAQASDAERLQLQALRDDFLQNVALLDGRETRVQRTVDLQLRILESLRSVPEGHEVVIPDSLAVALRSVGTIDPVRGTLDALIGSGRLDQLESAELRYALTEWPRLVSDVRTDQLEALQYMMRELIPFLATQGDFSGLFELDDPAPSVRMRATPELLTMISGKNVMDQWIVRDIAPLVIATREISSLLEAELER